MRSKGVNRDGTDGILPSEESWLEMRTIHKEFNDVYEIKKGR